MKRRMLLSLSAVPLCGALAQIPRQVLESEVVVIGGGAAGLSAAVTAAESGAKVLLIEKMEHLGGDTSLSGGSFNVVDPESQKAKGIQDSPELFYSHILASADGASDPEVSKILAYQSGDAFEWLKDHGMVFGDEIYSIYGGGWRRAQKPLRNEGRAYISALTECALKSGVQIKTACKAIALMREPSGRVSGVWAENKSGRVFIRSFPNSRPIFHLLK